MYCASIFSLYLVSHHGEHLKVYYQERINKKYTDIFCTFSFISSFMKSNHSFYVELGFIALRDFLLVFKTHFGIMAAILDFFFS